MTEASLNPPSSARADGLTIRVVMRTHVGRVRTENQDFGLVTPADKNPAKGRLMIVADGMGGHKGGATASRMAASIVESEYMNSGDDIPTSLRQALSAANAAILNEARGNFELHRMGTTCSILVTRGDEAHIAHVGDSRIYLIRGKEIKQLTEDHSLVATMVREGLLSTSEAEVHPKRNVLQRSVGVEADLDVDVIGPLKLQHGDCFVLCSDGLHGVVKPEEIQDVCGLPLEKAAEELINRALARGAPDNVTVIVARVE